VRAEGLTSSVRIIRGRAEDLPFADGSFDAVVFTFLLRYVEDRQAVIRELSRVLRPGGQMVSLEFFVPPQPLLRAMWLFHTRLLMPTVARALPGGWSEVGSFLGPSVSDFYRKHSLESLAQMWGRAGVENVEHKVLSLGGAVVTWGRKGELT
jgi:demethylmenaquinone methyltransferase/2-methoxy-6-polyprenyl-1,4-benzoquinol methylase